MNIKSIKTQENAQCCWIRAASPSVRKIKCKDTSRLPCNGCCLRDKVAKTNVAHKRWHQIKGMREKKPQNTQRKPLGFEYTQTVKQSFLKLWMQIYISIICHLKNLFVCGWRSKRKSSVSRKAFYNQQLFGIGLKTFLSTVAFQWIKCTGYEIRTPSSVTSLWFLLVSFGCYFKFSLTISVRFWFSLPLNAVILAFLYLCKALWVASCLNSAIERNVPRLALTFPLLTSRHACTHSQFPAWSASESIHQFSHLCFSAHTARAWLTWRDAGRRQE